MTQRICSIEGCERPNHSRSMCKMHYKRKGGNGQLYVRTSGAGVPVAERLASGLLVQPDGCIVWTRSVDRWGYGRITANGKQVGTHRVAYEIAYGPIPDGLLVRHSCDNPPCCNPAHLLLGTVQDNADDRVARGRGYRPSA